MSENIRRETQDRIAVLLEDAGYDKPWLVTSRSKNWREHEDGSVTFEIERHGGTVLGSVYAEIHRFRYADGNIDWDTRGRRQVLPKNASVTMADCQRVAAEYRVALDKGELPVGTRRAKKDGQLIISLTAITQAVFGAAPKQTMEARRARLRDAFEREGLLGSAGGGSS